MTTPPPPPPKPEREESPAALPDATRVTAHEVFIFLIALNLIANAWHHRVVETGLALLYFLVALCAKNAFLGRKLSPK